jgi:hypothetical protein
LVVPLKLVLIMINYFKLTLIVIIIFAAGVSTVYAAGTISGNQTAYIDNPSLIAVGAQQVNFAPTNASPVPDLNVSSGLTGQVWSSGLGWIQFSGAAYGVDVTCDASTQIGTFSGLAWGSTAGWINFSPTNGGVTIDSNGVLHGTAWIENAGWMVFDQSVGAGNSGYVQFDFACQGNSSSGGRSALVRYFCKDPDAINYTSSSFGRHNGSLCKYDEVTQEVITINNQENPEGLDQQNNQLCKVPFDTYHKKESYNPEIKRIQNFLNQHLDKSLVLDGINGGNTTQAIKDFQEKYREKILDPWNLQQPTGYWYQSTRYQANKILGCPGIPLILDNGYSLKY